MFHSLDRRFLYTAYRLDVVFNDYGNEKRASGTCFFVGSEGKPKVLVTSRHVLDPAFGDRNKEHWELKRITCYGFHPPEFHACVVFCLVDLNEVQTLANDAEDVAALPVMKVRSKSGGSMSLMDIPDSFLAREEYFEELLVADTLLYPGYPPWHDQSEGRPIMRRGQIASDPIHNYCGPDMEVSGRILAYEAFSFGGSSGSPVFIPAFGVSLNSENRYSGNFRDCKLIGVNGGHLLTKDGLKHHSGISYLFRSSTILELLSKI